MASLGFSAAEICAPVVGKDHNRHVLYTMFLMRYLDGKAWQLPAEEMADAELVREWLTGKSELEHCWQVEKSLTQKPLVLHGSPS